MKFLNVRVARKNFSVKSAMDKILGKGPNPAYTSFDEVNTFSSKEIEKSEPSVTTSKLANGVTVVSEKTAIPSTVNMGILLNLGTRDETSATSGALHSIQTTFYKSFAKTSETINYGMVQMCGGQYKMNFNRENHVFKATCLAHDTVDLFNMITDCALEPRNFNSCGVAMEKLPYSQQYNGVSGSHSPFTDTVFRSVYGDQGLGMQVWGNPKNYSKLDSFVMQKWQLENINPNEIVVCATGVDNHGEFHDLAEQTLSNLKYNNNSTERTTSVFQENDVRVPVGNSNSQFAVVFEGNNAKNPEILYTFLLSTLLGKVQVNNFDPLSLNQGKFIENLYNKEAYIHSIEASNFHFSDSGMFLLRANVSGNNVNTTLEKIANELKGVQKLSTKEFEAAKKRLSLSVLSGLDSDFQRVEEYLKQQNHWGTVKGADIVQDINSLTLEGLKKATKNLLSQKMNFVLESSDVSGVHSFDKIKGLFK